MCERSRGNCDESRCARCNSRKPFGQLKGGLGCPNLNDVAYSWATPMKSPSGSICRKIIDPIEMKASCYNGMNRAVNQLIIRRCRGSSPVQETDRHSSIG